MKKLLFAVFMFLCITAMCNENNHNDGKRIDITVIGQWGKNNSNGNSRSLDLLVATYNSSCLTINFNVSLGQTDIIIPIGNLPSGTYYITIICDGGSAEGEFRIENN